MKKQFFAALVFSVVLGVAGNGFATIIGGPGPVGYGDDDGTELFKPSALVPGLELYDLGGMNAVPSGLGFYFASDPATIIGLFGGEDQDPDPGGPGSIPQTASIDFVAGIVTDTDDGTTQATFTPGMGMIGLVHILDTTGIGGLRYEIFTEQSRNGGTDGAATFPSLSIPNEYIIGFEIFAPGAQAFTTLYAARMTGVVSVPEPATLVLLVTGLFGVAACSRKRNQ